LRAMRAGVYAADAGARSARSGTHSMHVIRGRDDLSARNRLRTPARRASLDGVSNRGEFRASDADRDQIVDRLHKAATEGRIASSELEQRVSTALKAQTYRELEATVSDLPGPARRNRVAHQRSVPGWAVSTVRANPVLVLFALPLLAATAAMLLAATIVWSMMMLVIFILGGRGRGSVLQPPWVHAARRGLRGGSRGPGRHWA